MNHGMSFDAVLQSIGTSGGSARERLRALFQACWEHALEDAPELATEVGAPGHNHRWRDLGKPAIARRKQELELPLAALARIDRESLGDADRLSYDLFLRDGQEALEGRQFPEELLPINQMGGVQQEVVRILSLMPARSRADYEDMLARLEAVPTLVEQTLELMREGAARGLTPPRVTLRDVPQQVENVIAEGAPSPLLSAFQRFPENVSEAQGARLRDAAQAVVRDRVAPAFRALQAFLVDSYIPRARTSIGLGELPDGEAWYAWSARRFTTTRLTPREIHEIGLAEVRRIRSAMEAVMAQAGFSGSFADCARFLRSDPRFFYTDPQELLRAYRDICKRADAELPRFFGLLPRLPYGVTAVPAHAERSQTTAYYEPGSLQSGRPGMYYANTYDLKTRPRWEMEALSLHEAVPGHHLQIALAQELPELPEFRKHARYTAYIEGWGLYAESLGSELGFYQDPWSRFGALAYEGWRAIRLVVDTGMHAFGWSREQAIDFFRESSSKAEHDIVVEIDRYIVWPGQALAYKVGELKLKELRASARAQLGEAFDIRAFHDEILSSGALPLDVLESRIHAWVQRAMAGLT